MEMDFKRFSKHLPHYLPLVGIFLAGIAAFIIFSYDRFFQMSVAISLSLAYLIWALVHHSIHEDLSWEVILEYLAISILGLSVLLSLIFRP